MIKVHKGFLDTALRVTAIAFLIIVTLSMASFGLSRVKIPGGQVAGVPADANQIAPNQVTATPGGRANPAIQGHPIGPAPLNEHLDRLGKRLEEIASSVAEERSTRNEIAKLAESVQAVHQQSGVTGDRLQQELSSLRVNNEVELRDLNRKIGDVSQRSQQLERELIEQRTGILSALESQRTVFASQVSRLEGGLDSVHSKISDLKDRPRIPLASAGAATLQTAGPLNSLAPVPASTDRNAETATGKTPWKEPVVLDSALSRQRAKSSTPPGNTRTATSIDWQVSPMSHSFPAGLPSDVEAQPQSLPLAPPAAEQVPTILPPLPEAGGERKSDSFPEPLKATLAPPPQPLGQQVPEIFEHDSAGTSTQQVSVITAEDDCHRQREFDVQATVIHIASSRPVDAEPGGVRMLNPALSRTREGNPWTHEAVTQELLRKVSRQAEATIAGRQKLTIHSDSTTKLAIGSSCPHCNEVHGFEAGDRLVVKARSGCDDIQRFDVSSETAGGGGQLDSIPKFKLTPETGHTYVISEEAIEGTVEESVTTPEDKLMPIHGVLTPVSEPVKTTVSTQLMQRLIVVTFRERNAVAATTVATVKEKLKLPAPDSIQKVAARKLTPVDRPPVFLPPPAPASAIKAPRLDSNVETLATTLPMIRFPKIWQTNHQVDEDYCEVCQQKHGDQDVAEVDTEPSDESNRSNPLVNWYRRVRGESTGADSVVTHAEFSRTTPQLQKQEPESVNHKYRRRYVTKPGNRRPVR